MSLTKSICRFTLLACIAASYGCTEFICTFGGECLNEAELEAVERWLLCEECTDELDQVVNQIGGRASRRLAGALERPSHHYVARIEQQLHDAPEQRAHRRASNC